MIISKPHVQDACGGPIPKLKYCQYNIAIHWKKFWKSIEDHRMEIVWNFIGNRMDCSYPYTMEIYNYDGYSMKI
jgi:hypothetical protein